MRSKWKEPCCLRVALEHQKELRHSAGGSCMKGKDFVGNPVLLSYTGAEQEGKSPQ